MIKLTRQQTAFMFALCDEILESGSPAIVRNLCKRIERSDSQVRNYLRILIDKGYVQCCGRKHTKLYMPSLDWADKHGYTKRFQEAGVSSIGGQCNTDGCKNLAEDFYRDGCYCRRCIVGHDDESDMEDIRNRYYENMSPKSSAGDLVDCVCPTYDDDCF